MGSFFSEVLKAHYLGSAWTVFERPYMPGQNFEILSILDFDPSISCFPKTHFECTGLRYKKP